MPQKLATISPPPLPRLLSLMGGGGVPGHGRTPFFFSCPFYNATEPRINAGNNSAPTVLNVPKHPGTHACSFCNAYMHTQTAAFISFSFFSGLVLTQFLIGYILDMFCLLLWVLFVVWMPSVYCIKVGSRLFMLCLTWSSSLDLYVSAGRIADYAFFF